MLELLDNQEQLRRYKVPNIKSQIKRVAVSAKQRESNNSKRTRVRNAVKKFTLAVEAKDKALADKLFAETISILDRAYHDGIYHINTVSRKKSTISRLFNTLKD